jgi:hypothetical protein
MHPDFSAAKIEKKKCANYASKYSFHMGLRTNINFCLLHN